MFHILFIFSLCLSIINTAESILGSKFAFSIVKSIFGRLLFRKNKGKIDASTLFKQQSEFEESYNMKYQLKILEDRISCLKNQLNNQKKTIFSMTTEKKLINNDNLKLLNDRTKLSNNNMQLKDENKDLCSRIDHLEIISRDLRKTMEDREVLYIKELKEKQHTLEQLTIKLTRDREAASAQARARREVSINTFHTTKSSKRSHNNKNNNSIDSSSSGSSGNDSLQFTSSKSRKSTNIKRNKVNSSANSRRLGGSPGRR